MHPKSTTYIFKMMPPMITETKQKDTLLLIFISLLLVSGCFLIQKSLGINLADEGYLCYGVLRTLQGDVPLRDFQSYDPGRYIWSALWLKVLGEGLIPIRLSVATFQFMGLTCGLLALRSVIKSYWVLTLAGVLLLIWMFPRHKLFDISISIAAVYFALILFEKPNLVRHYVAGFFVGIAAFFGRNHGLYTFTAYLLIILFIWLKVDRTNLPKRLMVWISGIIVGYSPMVFMAIFIPGFFTSFLGSITALIRSGTTNLPLPVPWPWKTDFSHLALWTSINQMAIGTFFLAMPLLYLVTIFYILTRRSHNHKTHPLFIVSFFIGLTYMHYAFSRADVGHLAHSIEPFLICLISLPILEKKVGVYSALMVIALLIISLATGGFVKSYNISRYKISTPNKIVIHGNVIYTNSQSAEIIKSVEQINAQLVKPDEQLLIAPHWPMLYYVLNRKSPVWEIYFVLPQSIEIQKKMIKQMELQNTNWVILGDVLLDGRDDLRFRNTHHLLWEYIYKNFSPVVFDGLPDNYQLLRRIQPLHGIAAP